MRPQRLAVGVWRLEVSLAVVALVAEAAAAVFVALAKAVITHRMILCLLLVRFPCLAKRRYGQTDLRTDGPTDLRTYGPTDLRTYGPMDLRTDRPSYRDARTHLKT